MTISFSVKALNYYLKYLLLFSLISIRYVGISRTTYTATTSGLWTTNSNWNPATGYPSYNTTNNNHDLIINITGSTPGCIKLNSNFELKSGTTLLIAGCDTLIITGNAIFDNNSVLEVSPCAVLIIMGDLENRNNSDEINVDGSLVVQGDFDGGNGSLISGDGTVDIVGTINLEGSAAISAIVLPIELIEFNAKIVTNHVSLNWSTASESNNSYFIVERSSNGTIWNVIENIPGTGNSSSIVYYSTIDNAPYLGISYYRLKQIDFDGDVVTFDPIKVFFQNDIHSVVVFPNPLNQNFLSVTLEGFHNETIIISILDIQGKELLSLEVKLSSGVNSLQIPVYDEFGSGLYFLTVNTSNCTYTTKLIVE